MVFLNNYAIQEILKDDEEVIYNKLLQRLNGKWTNAETNIYLQLSFEKWHDVFEQAVLDL